MHFIELTFVGINSGMNFRADRSHLALFVIIDENLLLLLRFGVADC